MLDKRFVYKTCRSDDFIAKITPRVFLQRAGEPRAARAPRLSTPSSFINLDVTFLIRSRRTSTLPTQTPVHGFSHLPRDAVLGTLAPFLRASESPIAIACFLLFTTPPFPPFPERNVPRFFRCNALLTLLLAACPYLAMISSRLDPSPSRIVAHIQIQTRQRNMLRNTITLQSSSCDSPLPVKLPIKTCIATKKLLLSPSSQNLLKTTFSPASYPNIARVNTVW
jgi:hypothetical protein